MKKFLTVVAIIAVVVIGVLFVRAIFFTGHSNATFISYAPGGKNMAYVTVDDVTGVHAATTEKTDFANGDRVKVKMASDGFYTITGGPY